MTFPEESSMKANLETILDLANKWENVGQTSQSDRCRAIARHIRYEIHLFKSWSTLDNNRNPNAEIEFVRQYALNISAQARASDNRKDRRDYFKRAD